MQTAGKVWKAGRESPARRKNPFCAAKMAKKDASVGLSSPASEMSEMCNPCNDLLNYKQSFSSYQGSLKLGHGAWSN